MEGNFKLLCITVCAVTVVPLCWAMFESSEEDGNSRLVEGHNQVLQNAFHEILDRRRRASSDLIGRVNYVSKENKSIDELSQTEKDFLLHIHNAYRSVVQPYAANMMEMVWDDEVAAFAQDWANQCEAKHRSNRNLSPWINMGENIYWIYSGKYHEGYATKFWWDEVQWYNYSTKACEEGRVCGHYITMVWASSARIGCGVKRCSRLLALPDLGRGAYYFVCNYNGRFLSNTRPYREHNTICSHCFRTDAPRCRYNLCVTQEMLDNDIGYNGSTAEIGLNRTRTSSSRKSITTAAPTTSTLSISTSLDTTSIDRTIPTSPETSTQTSIETSSVTSAKTETSAITSRDTTKPASPNTTIITPTDTTSNLPSETPESTSLSTVKSTFVSSDISTINTVNVTLSTVSPVSTTSNVISTTISTSVSKQTDSTDTTIKYETSDKTFILKAVDEIIEIFNSGNNLSMFSLQTHVGIAILVSYVLYNN